MKYLYFDCFSGISGDMILGALIDAGLPLEELVSRLRTLPIRGWDISTEKVFRGGISATTVTVTYEKSRLPRHFPEIRDLIEKAGLEDDVKEGSIGIFRRLADAEAAIHGINADDVHFHEVGAVDAIIDIVGAVTGIGMLGVDEIYASPISLGRGFVECAHGTIPIPSPATSALLKGRRVIFCDCDRELTTPTGAAILSTILDRQLEGEVSLSYETVGYGAGRRDSPDRPNLLRVFLGDIAAIEEIWVVETSIDDMNPEHYELLLERLFEAGALDVSLLSLIMKKGRPGIEVKVLTPFGRRRDVQDVLLRETTTFGVRFYPVHRRKLERDSFEIETRFGRIRVKAAIEGGKIVKISPEAADCMRAAREKAVTVSSVYEEVMRAARDEIGWE